MRPDRKIFLIGMPGSGKSFLGKELAAKLSLPFIDLDDAIVTKIGMPIADYFTKEGQSAFRRIEKDTLTEIISTHDEFVMATGGGAPCFFDNLTLMKGSGLTLYLETPKEVLIERNLQSVERPLMRGDVEKTIAEMLKTRLSTYQKAHLIIQDPDTQSLIPRINQFFKN